jgi:hypothetical protein
MKTLSVIFSVMSIGIFSGLLNGQNSRVGKNAMAAEVIAAIIKNTGTATIPNKVDIIKEGDPQTPVTGIVTCICQNGKHTSTCAMLLTRAEKRPLYSLDTLIQKSPE